jgi:hypothetical protein
MNLEMQVSPGIRKTGEGLTVITRKVTPLMDVIPGSTSDHEARHAVVAFRTGSWVIDATRIAGDGFSGRVRLNEFNAVAFMASKGCSGNSYDEWVVGTVMRRDTNAAASAAKSILHENHREVLAVARLIEAEGTVSGDRIWNAMQRASDPELEVNVIGRNGFRATARTRQSYGYFISVGLPDPKNS